MQQTGASAGADVGARLAIRLLQDAAESGELDPWDVDVIAVIDGFLDQLSQRINVPKQVAAAIEGRGGSYERDLADSSEAFLAASVLVGLKAELLEASILPPAPEIEEGFDAEFDEQGWLDPAFDLPRRPERHLQRRPVAPPPLRRPVTLGELIEQLESIAEQLESDELQQKRRQRQKRYSDREAIAQVSSLAHREKLPETTAALGVFLNGWEDALNWLDFEALVDRWRDAAAADLDTDRVGVFWALLFLSSQGRVELEQVGWLHAPIRLRRIPAAGSVTQLPISNLDVPASVPTSDPVAA
ncbi:segregation and condensation protein A [Synechococcus sp. KORDI-100]|uniref:segregation/condensation protein A n=1 Tax=Synechococcus sp. KORDI-100 TaxID=1280380 RepID=UPI0004E03278|nr:segregation/condensation protein A [Synechococcus sp. KORDI-100]AII44624.1 segregation and condensation protein A [Synechococcus sp. KORDI-100]